MGTFNITSSQLNSNYDYKDESLVVNGSFTKNAQNGKVQSISGSCYKKNEDGEEGDYIGNFNGTPNGDEILYSLSQMSRRNSNLVWAAIDEIEANVTGVNSEE